MMDADYYIPAVLGMPVKHLSNNGQSQKNLMQYWKMIKKALECAP